MQRCAAKTVPGALAPPPPPGLEIWNASGCSGLKDAWRR